MIDAVALIAFPDFATEKNGRFFEWDGQTVSERTIADIVTAPKAIVTLDYSSTASEIVSRGHKLPHSVIDLEELVVSASTDTQVSFIREEFSAAAILKRFGLSQKSQLVYSKLNCHSQVISHDIVQQVGTAMLRAFRVLSRLCSVRGEWSRFIDVEVPATKALYDDLMLGVNFDAEQLATLRESVEYDFYSALKTFSAKHDLPLDVPTDNELADVLEAAGFDLTNTSINYLLDFVSLQNGLGEDVQLLRRLQATRNALSGISHKKSVCTPEVDVTGTRTSRILLKSPSLQNLARKYRSVLTPRAGKVFSYVDYDQFEVGIMGALSGDDELLLGYANDDLYLNIAVSLFDDIERRRDAKKLFLSYAYGMRRTNLINAAIELGSTKEKATAAFGKFQKFEEWKKGVEIILNSERKVGTKSGNYFHLHHTHQPTAKEKRSAISQKVQGTGALIFKLAILEISKLNSFRVVLPMHDAVLVEHDLNEDPKAIVSIFEKTMTTFFEGIIIGKASMSNFAVE